ncbi:Eco57I restriction-modification methylase domain-containing protein [Micromonospora inaquosa]|uniref:site-specific DNA-methyltransferase (adenine-specific) n=1 Tax=Micromonospora inaquosa TaxID=2203716 RepID=A0A3N9WXW9_9ACTN|nr:SAM-dependent DNA methyltransferase [Micromonospora inaquosa]RQX05592.1 SAM-dependent methyltransferase [Micromonospora inaquosa]
MRTTHTLRSKTATELHRAWLELVETDGPFLAIPPLKRVWPQGMPALAPERLDVLREARLAFDHAWEALDIDPDDESVQAKYAEVRDVWVQTVLRDVVSWRTSLTWGPDCAPGVTAHSPDRRVTVTPQAALSGPDGIGALVGVVDKCDSLHSTGTDGWAATAIDRMEAMLRGAGISIGIVTDGRWWALVCARPDAMVASGIVDAQTWVEEPLTRNAFLTLIARQYVIGGDPNERLPQLFEESVAAAEEITEALGAQVRRAVELLVQAFAETAADHRLRGLPDPLPADPHDTYSAAVTVMMRIVFLLFAEERGLLPQSELFLQGYGISGELDALEQRRPRDGEESLDSTYLTWHRLLATSQALYRGASFENMRMPAYGGSLFDPERYPFLTASSDNGTLALPASDRVMLHVLRSVQVAQLKGSDARRISFRDVDVEQIGYIYEGLLGYSCTQVTGDTLVGLVGATGAEPEIPLTVLEQLADANTNPAKLAAAIIAWLKENQPAATPPSANAFAKRLATKPGDDADRMLRAVTDDDDLRARLLPWATITRPDLRDRPTIVLDGGLVVTETPSRRNAGAHYTPKDLAEDVVKHALEPLCYSPGPHQVAESSGAWKLRGSDEILNLKVADIAAGSGAFLVAAARYLAARLVEAWIDEDPANAGQHDLGQHAIREVVARCLYGADINAMAVEMCKLSLWLVSLDRNLPFSFVDDKILHGNSLLGLTDLRQLRALHTDPPEHQQPLLFASDLDGIIRRAVEIRRELASEVREHDPQRSATAKRRQLDRMHELTAQLRTVADGVVAAGLRLGGKPGKALDEAHENLADAVAAAMPSDGTNRNSNFLRIIVGAGLTPTVSTDYERWQPLHWVLEVADVFTDHGGFDAVIGNPAFLHSKKITTAYGKNYRDYLQNSLANGVKGDADLAAYFLLRQAALTKKEGSLGIVVTKSINQSHTKRVGLDQVLESGAQLVSVSTPFDWGPKGTAVSVVKLWLRFGSQASNTRPNPMQPKGPVPAQAYVGTYPNGDGFRVPASIAIEWIRRDPELRHKIHPYIRAADLAQGHPAQPSEYLIDLDGLSESEARRFAKLWTHLELNQRPWREKPSTKSSARERWWDFERSANAMYAELSKVERAIAFPRTSNLLMPRWVPSGGRIDMGVIVFPIDRWDVFAQLASSAHYHWTIDYAATTRDDPSYAPRRVSNTFPWASSNRPLPKTEAFENCLEQHCSRLGGLRPVVNAFNDPTNSLPDTEDLRDRYRELDREVFDMFGWGDMKPRYGFQSRNNLARYTVDTETRNEILNRLLEENLGRANKGSAASKPKRAERNRSPREGESTLF